MRLGRAVERCDHWIRATGIPMRSTSMARPSLARGSLWADRGQPDGLANSQVPQHTSRYWCSVRGGHSIVHWRHDGRITVPRDIAAVVSGLFKYDFKNLNVSCGSFLTARRVIATTSPK